MRIALTADPELPVPPLHYGGIERIVDMLVRGLERRGHEVTLFAHEQSRSAGRLVAWPGRSSKSAADTIRNSATLAREVVGGRFDIVHSFSRIAYLLPILPLPLPKLMTYQREINRRSVVLGHRLSRGTLAFSATSRFMMARVAGVGAWHLVFNGVPLASYDFAPDPTPNAPLIFLGRLEEIKGPHIAIEVAGRVGAPLVLAGNVPEAHRGWFEHNVAPHIDDDRVHYVGPVTDAQKNALLGSARAFLMPILWEEPFGIVMAEAMACGTPVIGFRRGSVPEVVADGVTGYVVDTVEEMAAAIERIHRIDRRTVRERVQRLFSDEAVIEGYLGVYKDMLTPPRPTATETGFDGAREGPVEPNALSHCSSRGAEHRERIYAAEWLNDCGSTDLKASNWKINP
jgi:glycosyltransferase involved in cell wall biosynthesis